MDKAGRVRWTDIGSLTPAELPAGKTHDALLGRFHVRDLERSDSDDPALQSWHMGVDAFARIWRVLPGLHYFAGLFRVPGIRQLTMLAYRLFLKWQSWHRRRREA